MHPVVGFFHAPRGYLGDINGWLEQVFGIGTKLQNSCCITHTSDALEMQKPAAS